MTTPEDLVRDYGMSLDKARTQAVAEIDGHRSAEHSMFVIEVEREAVGHLWLVERRDAYEPTLVVYDIDVDESHRGPWLRQSGDGLRRGRGTTTGTHSHRPSRWSPQRRRKTSTDRSGSRRTTSR